MALLSRPLLNVGSGDCPTHPDSGWTDIDVSPEFAPDVIGSVLALPFEDGCAERIYCGHVLEHVHPWDLRRALSELWRVLADDGELMVVGPDILKATQRDHSLADRLGIITGGRRWAGDRHEWVPTAETTARMFELSWEPWVVEELPIAEVPWLWPVVARIDWQFALRCRKGERNDDQRR